LSIAFVEVVRLTFINVLGSRNRVMTAPPPDSITIPYLFRTDFTNMLDYYYLIMIFMIFTLSILYKIEISRLGAILKSIAQSDLLAECIGINVMRYKVLALSICSFFAGLTGGLFAPYTKIISPESFTVWTSMLLLILLIVGGIESFWGPVIGAIILTIIPEFLPTGPIVDRIIYGSLIILTLRFLPKGLVTFPEVARQKLLALRRL
jgi:branched-chain amino acid transport system permease protein